MLRESNMNLDRWARLMAAWGFHRNEETCNALLTAYSEKGRYYHTQEHVSNCLAFLDRCVSRVDFPHEVEMALWFHDAVYNPLSGGNEKKSADWCVTFLSQNGAAGEATDRVHRLIMATEHNAPAGSRDESLLVDIDLAILGSDAATYAVFEQGVRKEYKRVPSFLYRKKRAEVLEGFLNRDRIYANEPFFSLLETRARKNLSDAVSRLKGKGD